MSFFKKGLVFAAIKQAIKLQKPEQPSKLQTRAASKLQRARPYQKNQVINCIAPPGCSAFGN
jgi:hypothetical protein